MSAGEAYELAALQEAEERAERAEARVEELEEALKRAVYLAQRTFDMVPREVWRDSGGDDGQGHYEGEYRAEQLQRELRRLAALVEERRRWPPCPRGVLEHAFDPCSCKPPQTVSSLGAVGLRNLADDLRREHGWYRRAEYLDLAADVLDAAKKIDDWWVMRSIREGVPENDGAVEARKDAIALHEALSKLGEP